MDHIFQHFRATHVLPQLLDDVSPIDIADHQKKVPVSAQDSGRLHTCLIHATLCIKHFKVHVWGSNN
jgi:hypothetical protein